MNKRKGIILAGGSGTRLHPVTSVVNKHLLPIYDKPMIFYPLCTLMLSGIRDILVISTPRDLTNFQQLLGDGAKWGMNLSYAIQEKPEGIAQAFIIGKNFLGNNLSALILGDNIFFGNRMQMLLEEASNRPDVASIFAYQVSDPERYGVVAFDNSEKALKIEEKPTHPMSNFAVTGLYFYDNDVTAIASRLKPSQRGELEISDINQIYLESGKLLVKKMGRGYAWLDTGTHDSLLEASSFVATIQKRQGLNLSCPEEIAFKKGWISDADLVKVAEQNENNYYGKYLLGIANGSKD